MSIRGIPKSKDSDSVVQLSVHDDGFDVEKNNDERLPQHWPSARDSQEELVLQKGVKTPSSSYERDFGNATPGTFEDDWFEDSTEEKPSKYRVKSAPCSTKRNRPMFRRKALSAGKQCYESSQTKSVFRVEVHSFCILLHHSILSCIFCVFSMSVFCIYQLF